jgi:hypothetical protein
MAPMGYPSLGILAFPLYGLAVRHFGRLFPRSVTLGSWFGVSVFRLEHQNSAILEMKNQLDIVDATNISCRISNLPKDHQLGIFSYWSAKALLCQVCTFNIKSTDKGCYNFLRTSIFIVIMSTSYII